MTALLFWNLCYRNALIQIHILDGVQDLDALCHRALEGFAAGDQTLPPARLLMTAVAAASAKSFSPEAPPLLIRPTRPM